MGAGPSDDEVVERFRGVLRIATVARPDESEVDVAAFEKFHVALSESFPLLHEHLELHRVLDHSLLSRTAQELFAKRSTAFVLERHRVLTGRSYGPSALPGSTRGAQEPGAPRERAAAG